MKRLLLFILLWSMLATGSSLAAEPPVPEVWTARAAVDFALHNSPDSRVASQRILEARALLQKAEVSFYPQIGLSGSYTQTDNPMYSFGNIINQGAYRDGIDFNAPGRTDNLNLGVGAEYRFYNGGQDLAHQAAAAAGVELSAAERESIQLRLGFEAFRQFQQIVEAEAVLHAQSAALDALRSSLKVAAARYNAGDLLKVDLLNIEVQESRTLESQIQAVHNLELAKQIFLTLLGLSADEVHIDNSAQESPSLPESRSADQRPELQRLQAALRASEAQRTAARGSRRPTLDGFASYQYDQGTVLDGSGDSWMAGLKVNFKLFDGHSAAADIALAEARLGGLRAEQRKLTLTLALEIKRANLALNQARLRRQLTLKMVEQATESEQLSRARFEAGVILASDLIDTETRLTDARVRHAVATSAIKIAIADLRRATGLAPFPQSPNLTLSMENQ